jgi:hypothetical protein
MQMGKPMVEGKRRGRPPLEPGRAKRASFNTRIRPALKLALDTAAKEQGRSLSEEIEFRLERSLDEERPQMATFRNGILIGFLLAFRSLDKAQDILNESALIFEIVAEGELPAAHNELVAAHNELVKALDAIESAEVGKSLDAAFRKLRESTARFGTALKKTVAAEGGEEMNGPDLELAEQGSAGEPPQ